MTPTPQENIGDGTPSVAEVADGDRVVISGIAGLYPKARYIRDLESILYNKVNPVSSDDLRWKYNHPEVGQYTGNVPDLDLFDAQFFKVHYKLGNNMDSMSRKILEQTFEAIYDAGISPKHLSGKKVGVYIGTCFSESEKALFYAASTRTGFGIAGCSKSMFANRISYWLNAKGPSMSIDEACCSSTGALEQAYKDISRGECEAAIVGGANLCLHPQSSVHYSRIMKISMDGKTKSFDEDAGGCAKSEAVNVLFLQKAKDAKRIYAEVVHVKCEFVSVMDGEVGPKYGFYRNPADTARFLNTFYKEAGINPDLVEYVEAMGSAVPEVDKSELEAIDKVFCGDRKVPLLIGSVMSNIGYGEAASGISAITKVLLGYHKGELAGNLHCETPRRDVAALQEGRMQVVTTNKQFQRTYTAVNSMSVTGVNAHVLLHGHYKPKDFTRYYSNIPRLVTISGRQESSVQKVFDYLKAHPIDPEEIALLHNIHETNISGHLGKGFIILESDINAEQKTICLSERNKYSDDATRPLWFVYSGMGSQWAGMGAQLMRIPIFAAAIERCRIVLEPKGIDIVHIITSPDPIIFDNILHSFVGIAAIQIGLTDVLTELGLVPDKIIGHSVGELGCAYADGCLTAEEMILSAYSRGRVSLETPFIRGSMAAVGIGFQQMSKMCPPEIEIACHNSAESCTISGPAEEMRTFVTNLNAKKIFAKEVPCSNIAYHSRYIAKAGPGLLKYLKDVIKTPRARSERWVSTSVPECGWNEPAAKYSSAEYHTHNLLNPVLFEEASRLIPPNAVLVEVAPHGLLQAILTRSLPTATHVPITRRNHRDCVLFLLEAIGILYMEGYKPKVRVLYPKVEFPVSTGTPYLSHYVDWAHQENWPLPLYQSAHRTMTATRTLLITLHDDEYTFLRGHVIRSKVLVPFAFALVAAWDTLAMSLNIQKKSMSVQFLQVQFFAQPILNSQKTVRLSVSLHRGNGRFEIMNEESTVATGFINCIETSKIMESHDVSSSEIQSSFELGTQDVYRLLSERGYAYSGQFRSILSTNDSISTANVLWNDNWVTFIDGLFQLNTLKYTSHGVSIPENMGRMIIDIEKHHKSVESNIVTTNDDTVLQAAHISDVLEKTRCGGILIENIRLRKLLPMKHDNLINLHTLKFFPRFHSNIDVSSSLNVLLQIVAENITKEQMNIIELVHGNECGLLKEFKKIAIHDILPEIQINYQRTHIDDAFDENKNVFINADLILVNTLSTNREITELFHRSIKVGTFIINEDIVSGADYVVYSNMCTIVSVLKNKETQLELAYWRPASPETMISTFTVNSDSDIPLLIQARNEMPTQNSLIILSSYPPVDELRSLVKQWRKDDSNNSIHLIMVNENPIKDFMSDELPVVNLAYNIFDNGSWGGEYYMPIETNTINTYKNNGDINATTLQVDMVGNIDSLHWFQTPKPTTAGVLVTVHYAGINVSDVKRALGQVNSRNDSRINGEGFGMEFSGITESGERVMGLIKNHAASSHVVAQPEMMWPVPSYWSLEDAATVPFAYFYAYYCLVIKATARITTKQVKQYSVLIHGGTGALGQAAISVALSRGYRVFTTVADASKKRFLLRLFPELNENDIGNSRDASFEDIVLNATNSEGCNLVICCLKGELKNTSFKCCGPSSSLIDTEQILSNENYMFGMYNLTNEKSYVAVDITGNLDPKTKEFNKIREMITEGISRGHVRPLTRVVFPPHEAARAFRLLAASRHRGRVLLRLHDALPIVKPSLISEAESCHLVICDLSPLGLQLADKLVDSGAKKIHLHFKTLTPFLQYKQRIWEKNKIQVVMTSGNLDDITDVSELLNIASRLGTIEGLHIINSDGTLHKNIVKNFDLATRSVCKDLKFFMVLTNAHSYGYLTSIQRAKDELPITILDLSILEKVQDADGVTWYSGAMKALELALRTSDTILLAQTKSVLRLSLVQQISALTGLPGLIEAETPNSTSLENLGLPSEKSSSVCLFLKDVYNICLEEEDVSLLTVDKIKKLEDMVSERHFEEVKGIGAFYSYVDPDELMATTEIVIMQTLTNHSTARDDEFDVNQTYLCIVPGLEGHYARFRTLCELLKLPAFVLQPGLDHPDETPRELATRYSKILLKKTGLTKTFYILGYETGVAVALELTSILEDNGLTGTVFCLGGGPAETAALVQAELRSFGSAGALQAGVARHMFSLMAGAAAAAAAAERGCGSWRERVDACVRTLLGRVSHSAQYARALLEAAYARLGTQRRYSAEPQALRSRIVLMRACDVPMPQPSSLQRYSQRPLAVHDLAAPLAHAAADLQVPAVVNGYLDDDVLAAYNGFNYCDAYLSD